MCGGVLCSRVGCWWAGIAAPEPVVGVAGLGQCLLRCTPAVADRSYAQSSSTMFGSALMSHDAPIYEIPSLPGVMVGWDGSH